MTKRERNGAALKASLVALGVIAAFALFGRAILDYLRISLEALQVAGGLLLLLVAMQLLMGEYDTVDEEKPRVGNVAIVPLGTPLLAGPGAIVATMLAVQTTSGIGYLIIAAALLCVILNVYLFMRFASGIQRVIKDTGTILLSRIAGLLLAAIAVQMMVDGIMGFVRGF
jgi:multiple antibiotic resistance protein